MLTLCNYTAWNQQNKYFQNILLKATHTNKIYVIKKVPLKGYETSLDQLLEQTIRTQHLPKYSATKEIYTDILHNS